MSRPVGVALIGMGWWGKKMLSVLGAAPADIRVVRAVEPNLETARTLCDVKGVALRQPALRCNAHHCRTGRPAGRIRSLLHVRLAGLFARRDHQPTDGLSGRVASAPFGRRCGSPRRFADWRAWISPLHNA